MGIRNLERALRPRRLAVVSEGSGELARLVLRNLLQHNYRGDVFLVGEALAQYRPLPAMRRVRELPVEVDLALVDAPESEVAGLVRSCAEEGLPGVLIMTQDAPHRVLQSLNDNYPDTRIIGPGSLGLLVPALQLNASVMPGMPAHGGLALVSSSSPLWTELTARAECADLGISHLLSLGDQVDVDLADVTDYLHGRGRVQTLLLDVDRLPTPHKLLPAVWSFSRDRPVVACRCDCDWEWQVFAEALRRAGGVPVRRGHDLINLVELLARADYPPLGHKMAVLTEVGTEEVLEDCATKTRELAPATRALLRQGGCREENARITLPPQVESDALLSAAEALLFDSAVHMLLANLPSGTNVQVANRLAAAATNSGKPLVAVTSDQRTAQALRTGGVAVYTLLADAADALRCLAECTRNLDLLHQPWGSLPAGPTEGGSLPLTAGEIPKEELRALLARWGVRVDPAAAGHNPPSLLVRLRRHPVFGSVVLASSPDELGEHPAVGLPPLTEPLARSMLSELFPRLAPAVSRRLVLLLLQLSRLAVKLPQLVELDLGPVFVVDGEATALGARGRSDPTCSQAHLSLCPYPDGSVQSIRLRDGTCATLRPIRPDDEPLWRRMLTSSSPDSLRLRYHSVHHEPSRRMGRRHCCIDYRRELVMVAEVKGERGPSLAGEGELFLDPDCDLAEFAVFVADSWQGRGLGSLLTDHMVDTATELGARRITCELTPDNVRMISLLQRRGFEVRIVVEDGVVFAEKPLR